MPTVRLLCFIPEFNRASKKNRRKEKEKRGIYWLHSPFLHKERANEHVYEHVYVVDYGFDTVARINSVSTPLEAAMSVV